MARCDVVKHQFIRMGLVVKHGLFHRIPRVHVIEKLHPLDHPRPPLGIINIQTRNNAFG
jgi:hypothetical protein